MTKTFIFDLGKVIVNFDHSRIVRSIEQFCDYDEAEIYQRIFSTDAIQNYEIGKTNSIEFFAEVKYSLDLRMSFGDFEKAWNSTFDLEPILSDQLIEKLAQKYRLIVLSDTNEMHFDFIKQHFPILRHFVDFVLSYEVGALKPFPEIFQRAVEKANCLPDECFFTDDREGNIEGAKLFGINAVQFISPDKFEDFLQKHGLFS